MADTLPVVRTAVAADADVLCSALADAFAADPVWGWAFGDAARRRERHLAWFAPVVAQGVANGAVRMTDGGEAVAVWVPPGAVELTGEQETALAASLRDLCGAQAELVLECFAVFEEHFPVERAPHYLSLLATADRHRGRGLGMHVLRTDLAGLDRAGAPAYLESTNPANLRRYEGAGFEPYGTFAMPSGGPVVTQMWREPRSA